MHFVCNYMLISQTKKIMFPVFRRRPLGVSTDNNYSGLTLSLTDCNKEVCARRLVLVDYTPIHHEMKSKSVVRHDSC